MRVRIVPPARPRTVGVATTIAAVASVLVLLGAASTVRGQERTSGRSTLSTSIDTTLVTVGDRVNLEVTVEHPADAAVSWPDSVDAGPFEMLETRISPTRTGDGSAVSTAVFSMTAFELGELEVPSFDVTVLHADGSEEVLETDRYGVEIVSVGVEETGDIRDIRGPLAIPVSALRLVALAVLLMLAGAGVYALVRRLRSGDEAPGELPSGLPPRPAHEVALEELARLEASPLLSEGRVKDFHIRVSEILRRYVEERFRVPALEMTTWEVLGGLQAAGVAEDLRRDLRRFLDQCDLVKFAKARPTDEESRAVLELGRELVERSVPEPDPVKEEDALVTEDAS